MRNSNARKSVAALAVLLGMAHQASRASELLVNSGFEDASVAAAPASNGSFAYPNTTYGGWTYVTTAMGSAGLIDATKPVEFLFYGTPSGYQGSQFALLQSTGVLSQTFTADKSGTLNISWIEAGRYSSSTFGGDETYAVQINGTAYGSYSSATAQNFTSESLAVMGISAGSAYTLSFVGSTPADETAFLDSVSASVSPVPEPATWALMLAGAALLATLRSARADRPGRPARR